MSWANAKATFIEKGDKFSDDIPFPYNMATGEPVKGFCWHWAKLLILPENNLNFLLLRKRSKKPLPENFVEEVRDAAGREYYNIMKKRYIERFGVDKPECYRR